MSLISRPLQYHPSCRSSLCNLQSIFVRSILLTTSPSILTDKSCFWNREIVRQDVSISLRYAATDVKSSSESKFWTRGSTDQWRRLDVRDSLGEILNVSNGQENQGVWLKRSLSINLDWEICESGGSQWMTIKKILVSFSRNVIEDKTTRRCWRIQDSHDETWQSLENVGDWKVKKRFV